MTYLVLMTLLLIRPSSNEIVLTDSITSKVWWDEPGKEQHPDIIAGYCAPLPGTDMLWVGNEY